MPSLWEVRLRREGAPGVTLRPTASGVHAVTSRWLHADAPARSSGEAHASEHLYSVAWAPMGSRHAAVRLALLDDSLQQPLRERACPGAGGMLGQAAVVVESLTFHRNFALLPDTLPSVGRWRLTFPAGVTFNSHGVYSPWPSPERVLNSLLRRQSLALGLENDDGEAAALAAKVTVVDADLRRRHHWIGTRTAGAPRPINCVAGEVEWAIADRNDAPTRVARLLEFGTYSGVGAKTAWGIGVLVARPSGGPVRSAAPLEAQAPVPVMAPVRKVCS